MEGLLHHAATRRMSMTQSLLDAVPLAMQAISNSANSQRTPNEVQAALTCLEKWIAWGLPAKSIMLFCFDVVFSDACFSAK